MGYILEMMGWVGLDWSIPSCDRWRVSCLSTHENNCFRGMLSPPAATNTLLLITFFLQKYKIVKNHIMEIKSTKLAEEYY